MISENSYLVPQSVKKSYGQQNRFLLIVTDLEKEMDKIRHDPVVLQVEALQKTLEDSIKTVKDKV